MPLQSSLKMKRNNKGPISRATPTKSMAASKIAIPLLILVVLYAYLNPIVLGGLGFDYGNYVVLDALGSYILIVAITIILGANHLESLHDRFSLWTIVIGCLLAALYAAKSTGTYRYLFLFLGILLAAYIIVNRRNVVTPSWKSLFIALMWSLGAVVTVAFASALLGVKSSPIFTIRAIVNTFTFQLAFVSVTEEGLFRGLILGLLRASGAREDKALVVQAILFWGVHYLDISEPRLFFVVIPLGTVFMTFVLKKQKFLYTTIMVHTFLNAFWALLATFITTFIG